MEKTSEVSYQNKDIASKTFAELFPKESLEVYGIHLPKIVRILPTNLPAISSNELRIDNIFELEDGSFAIIDYESTYKRKHKIKYMEYILRILKRYRKRKNIRIRMIVLYTADIEPKETSEILDVGAVKIEIEQAFLSELDSEAIRNRLTRKIHNKEKLTNKELMEFVILPLTYKGKEKKREVIEELFTEAKEIEDEKIQIFLLTGVMVFADKVIDEKIANQMKEWIMMTKVARLFELEKLEAVEKAKKEVTEKVSREEAQKCATAMLKEGDSIEKIARCVQGLTVAEIQELAKQLQ